MSSTIQCQKRPITGFTSVGRRGCCHFWRRAIIRCACRCSLRSGAWGSGSVFMSFWVWSKEYVCTYLLFIYIYYWSFSRHSSRNRVCWSVQMFLVFTCTKFSVKQVWSLDAAKCHTWVISTLSIAHYTFCLGFCTQIHSICLWEASQYMSWSLTTDKSLRFHIAAVHPAVISYKKNSGES
jgi:hypothetical protein